MQNTKKYSIIQNDSRLTLAKDWINELIISKSLDFNSLQTASEDASFRRYFRINDLTGLKSMILMDSPPNKESVKKFVDTSKIFYQAKLQVPKIFEINLEDGFLILEDFGNKTYLEAYETKKKYVFHLLENAWDNIIKLQSWGLKNPRKCSSRTAFSKQLLFNEMLLFNDWYLIEHLKINLLKNEKDNLKNTFKLLSDKMSNEPKVIVHRDFHSRNLMILDRDNPTGILDFQDAVLGPVSYDLASLLRDAYFNWDRKEEIVWAKIFWSKAKKTSIPIPNNFNDFLVDFDWNSIQRHLKILGIFCRLAHRDNKQKYLKDLNRVKIKCFEIISKYKEFKSLLNLFEKIENISFINES